MKECVFHDVQSGRHDRRLFEIVEDCHKRRDKVLVYASSRKRAEEIDRFLWILKQEAFIPHTIGNRGESLPPVPVVIVTEEINPGEAATLVADGHCSIEFATTFDSVHEFVNRSSPEIQQECRERFRSYRESNVPVKHIKQ
jgi:DNA polymerase IIIc chi subunit